MGRQHLHDDRRYEVPVTVISCEFPSSMLHDWIEARHPFVAELALIREVEYIDLPTGHWPQFTRPEELAQAILASVDGSRRLEIPAPGGTRFWRVSAKPLCGNVDRLHNK